MAETVPETMPAEHVCIIGDGPAANACALHLVQHPDFTGQLVQVCAPAYSGEAIGETLPPGATPLLAQLGLQHLLHAAHLDCPGSLSLWGSDTPGYNDFFYTPIGQGFHLDRALFNQQLSQASATAGVERLEQCEFKAIAQIGGAWQLSLNNNEGDFTLQTHMVIDATGARSRVAKAMGVARNQFDKLVALCAFFPIDNASDKLATTLISAAAEGWWYAARLPNDRGLICLNTDATNLKLLQLNHPDKWWKFLEATPWLLQSCEQQWQQTLTKPTELLLRPVPSAILSQVANTQWLAIGDAAASYDSVTSAGIIKALSQGIAAADAIATYHRTTDASSLSNYQAQVFSEFNQYMQLHQQLYRSETRFAQEGFWQRRLRA